MERRGAWKEREDEEGTGDPLLSSTGGPSLRVPSFLHLCVTDAVHMDHTKHLQRHSFPTFSSGPESQGASQPRLCIIHSEAPYFLSWGL